jgi:hypothetical protein
MSKASRDDTLLCAERLAREILHGEGIDVPELSDDMRNQLGFAAKEVVSAIQLLRFYLQEASA